MDQRERPELVELCVPYVGKSQRRRHKTSLQNNGPLGLTHVAISIWIPFWTTVQSSEHICSFPTRGIILTRTADWPESSVQGWRQISKWTLSPEALPLLSKLNVGRTRRGRRQGRGEAGGGDVGSVRAEPKRRASTALPITDRIIGCRPLSSHVGRPRTGWYVMNMVRPFRQRRKGVWRD